jgi:hypothetical protein
MGGANRNSEAQKLAKGRESFYFTPDPVSWIHCSVLRFKEANFTAEKIAKNLKAVFYIMSLNEDIVKTLK